MSHASRTSEGEGRGLTKWAWSAGLGAALTVVLVLAWNPSWHAGMPAAALGVGALLVAARRRGVLSPGRVLVLALALRLLFLALPPLTLSDDGARYVWDGIVQVEEGTNPYRYAPDDPALAARHDAPVYARLNSASYHSVYPPASQAVFAAGAFFHDAFGWRASFYLVNALFALMESALAWLLWRAGTGAPALLLYALHPLVLLEAAGQGHTEAGAALGLVAAVLAARSGRGRLASVALAAAVLFKLYPLVLVPFLWRRFGGSGLWPGAVVGAFLGAPYAAGVAWQEVWHSFQLYVRLFEFNAGPYYALKGIAWAITGADWSKTLGPALRWVFLLGLPVLYVLDARRQWPLGKAFFWTIALFMLCATTVHPWYLVPLLALAAVRERPAWPWQWLALCSTGTYLLYAPSPHAEAWYWGFVVAGWGGAAVLAVALGGRRFWEAAVRPLVRRRARRKASRVLDLLPEESSRCEADAPLRLLDLGAGEGFVGAAIQEDFHRRSRPAEVVLADVGAFNQTDLPYHVYDGRSLPFAADAFDVVVLYFVLHHAADPAPVLREALRVAGARVVIAESVFESEPQRRLLRFLDRAANRLRCGGAMAAGPLHLRRAAAWRSLIEAQGGRVTEEEHRGRWLHRQAFFSVESVASGE